MNTEELCYLPFIEPESKQMVVLPEMVANWSPPVRFEQLNSERVESNGLHIAKRKSFTLRFSFVGCLCLYE